MKLLRHKFSILLFFMAILCPLLMTAAPKPLPTLHETLPHPYLTENHRLTDHKISKGMSPIQALKKWGLKHSQARKVIQSLKPFLSATRIPEKMKIQIKWKKEKFIWQPIEVSFRLNPQEILNVTHEDPSENIWKLNYVRKTLNKEVIAFQGDVGPSLWHSALNSGMNQKLIIELTSLFSSLIDFRRELVDEDKWRLLVEAQYVDGRLIGYGPISIAQFVNQKMTYTAVRYKRNGLSRGYYTPEGKSLSRLFLKSPLTFGRITSRFSWGRMHPILKTRRPHLGVDYGAPTGTPVMSVGDGVITKIGKNRGGGNTIKIKHSSKYQTAYMHLNGFALHLKKGSPVKMGQVIGYVGQTGLASGPHLHFEFYVNNQYVDPLGLKFPSRDPLPKKYLEDFHEVADSALKALPDWKKPGQVR